MTAAARPLTSVTRWLRDLGRAAQWHRRLLAAGLLAGSVAFAIQAAAPPPPATVPVVAIARDAEAGHRLSAQDLSVVRRTPDTVPAGAIRDPARATGATLLSGVRRGELITDARLVGPSGLGRLGPGLVAAPVRIADAESVRLVRAGAVVDVLAAGSGTAHGPAAAGTPGAPARLVASAVRVLAVPRPDGSLSGLADGALVLLATSELTAARLAGAAVTDRLSLVLRGP